MERLEVPRLNLDVFATFVFGMMQKKLVDLYDITKMMKSSATLPKESLREHMKRLRDVAQTAKDTLKIAKRFVQTFEVSLSGELDMVDRRNVDVGIDTLAFMGRPEFLLQIGNMFHHTAQQVQFGLGIGVRIRPSGKMCIDLFPDLISGPQHTDSVDLDAERRYGEKRREHR